MTLKLRVSEQTIGIRIHGLHPSQHNRLQWAIRQLAKKVGGFYDQQAQAFCLA